MAVSSVVLSGLTVVASGATIAPSYFPAGVGLDGNAYVLQFAGSNREATAAAVDLESALSGGRTGGYPYSTASSISSKSDRSKLYGPATCPTTVVLAADDTPADALAASGLRGQSSLPLTGDNGAVVHVDTTHADLLLTQSARSGATTLDATTSSALTRIRGACTGPMHGIVLGGTEAVAPAAAAALAAQLTDVVRISGATRFDTAAQIAQAVATAETTLPTINFYPVPSVRSPAFTNGKATLATANQDTLVHTVFLAEGATGADALAIGPLAASLGVPILLSDSSNLPDPTAAMLRKLDPGTIVVLGGTVAIADSVLAQAMAITPMARVQRVAGPSRFATAVAIAKQLFNLYPDYVPTLGAAGYSDQLFGLARDEGSASGGDHVGWPDALAAAFYLADASGGGFAAPARAAPPVELSSGSTTQSSIGGATAVCGTGTANCYPTVPLLLTTGAALAPEVDSYLQGMYPKGPAYKVGGAPASATNDGGFGLVFGGTGAVSGAVQNQLAVDLSGQTYTTTQATDLAPTLVGAKTFFTHLNLSNFIGPPKAGTTPVFTSGATTDAKVCVAPGGVTGAAGIAAVDDAGSSVPPAAAEYFQAASTPYPDRLSLGACVDVAGRSVANVSAVGLSGHESQAQVVEFPPTAQVSVVPLGGSVAATGAGTVFLPVVSGASETEALTVPRTADAVTFKGTAYPSASVSLAATLTRTNANAGKDIISWTGTLVAYADKTTAHPLFTVPVGAGYADATPSSGLAGVIGTINLVGVSVSPVPGAVVLTVAGGLLGTTVTNLAADGLTIGG